LLPFCQNRFNKAALIERMAQGKPQRQTNQDHDGDVWAGFTASCRCPRSGSALSRRVFV
jgi:hypothetical protein